MAKVHRNFLLRLVNSLAYWLRRFPLIHRPHQWVRRTLLLAVSNAFWEFVRILFAKFERLGPPAKVFSVYQALRCGWPRINGRIVLHDQGQPVVTGDSLLVRSGFGQHSEQPWPILWSEHHNARLITESLACLLPGKELCLESVYNGDRWRSDSASRYLRLPPATRLSGPWTSIISSWTPTVGVPVYGHWLHDALPRLALLPEFPPETGILVPPTLAPYQVESLEMLGLWNRCRPTPERHVEVERYFFSAPTSMITCYNPYAVNYLRSAFLPKRDRNYTGPRKFFFQRTGKLRPIENNEEIADFFRGQGWGVVKDMDLNFAQTVKLFSEAEAICSSLGSNMCNLMFCQPGCTVLQLVLDGWVDGFVDWIAQVGKLDYHFKVVPCGGKYMHRIVVDMGLLKEFFDAVVVDRNHPSKPGGKNFENRIQITA